MSVDGIGAFRFDLFRTACNSLCEDVLWETLSVDLREDDMGEGEGGEQGDPLMPLLLSLGQHRALLAVNERFIEGESLFAFL